MMIMTLGKLMRINYDDYDTGETDENKLQSWACNNFLALRQQQRDNTTM